MGLTSGIIQQDAYAGLDAAVTLASIISPIILRRAYEKDGRSL